LAVITAIKLAPKPRLLVKKSKYHGIHFIFEPP
jgi:hypothetical protein